MSIAINPIFPVIGAQEAVPAALLQPGTVIDATVLKVLDANLVRIAIANLSIDALTEVPLKAGQALQLAVSQTEQGVKLAIVPQPLNGEVAKTNSPSAGALASSITSTNPDSDQAVNVSTPVTNVASTIAAQRPAPADAPLNTRTTRPLTNIEVLAVSAAVQSAAAKQTSLSPLFANLNVAATLQSLSPALQEAAAKLLAVRPALNAALSGGDIKAAFEKSGLFLEQSLAAKANASSPALHVAPSSNQAQTSDVKAALIIFRQTVASWLGDAAEGSSSLRQPAAQSSQSSLPTQAHSLPADVASQNAARAATQGATAQPGQIPSPPIAPSQTSSHQYDEILLPQSSLPVADDLGTIDPKIQIYAPSESLTSATARTTAANAGLTSLQEVLQAFPKGVRDAVHALLDAEGNPQPQNVSIDGRGTRTVGLSSETTDVPPPPFRGAAPSAQPVAAPSLAPDAEPIAVARHLIDDADAALARQTLLQVASMPDRADIPSLRPDTNVPRWNFEIPFATPQGTAVAQFEISRDGEGVSIDPSRKVWRARFSLNVEPQGPVHALVTLSGERASVRMWAERPATAAQLRANVPQLSHALREAALEPGDIVIGDGAPPQPAKPLAGHFLDRAL